MTGYKSPYTYPVVLWFFQWDQWHVGWIIKNIGLGANIFIKKTIFLFLLKNSLQNTCKWFSLSAITNALIDHIVMVIIPLTSVVTDEARKLFWLINGCPWINKAISYRQPQFWNFVTRGNPLSTYAKFSEKLTFLTLWYAHVSVRIRGLEMLVFRKNLRTYLMDVTLSVSVHYCCGWLFLHWSISSSKIL